MRQLGKYEVLEEVGQGGMSVVYRGRDTVLGREVAIKVMHPFMAQKSDAKKRFCREAMAVAKLSHPNILEIYDYSGENSEQAYIVMEFIRGETLSSFASRVQMDLPELGLLVIRALATALTHAHEQGIIHRDLKPENVMIRADGRLKLMDFGIAQMIDADTLTTTGALLGSPAHMSPELIEGELTDIRSDIFSVGTILYWLMTRRLPFSAPTAPALFKRIIDGHFDDPRMHNALVTSGMMRVLMKLMKKKREERYQTVSEFVVDLDKELALSGIESPDDSLRRFLADPPGFQEKLKTTLRTTLLAHGDAAADRSEWAVALEAYDRLLALDPSDGALREKVLTIGRRQRRQRRFKRALRMAEMASGGMAICIAIALLGWHSLSAYFNPPTAEPDTLSAGARPVFVSQRIEARPPLAPGGPVKAKGEAPPEPAVERDVDLVLPVFGTLFIDGVKVGEDLQGEITRKILSGKHRMRVESLYMEAIERDVEIAASGTLAPIILKLERWKPAQLRIVAIPGTQITLDGVARGEATSTPFTIAMTGGTRLAALNISVPGQPPSSAKVEVRAGQVTEYDARR